MSSGAPSSRGWPTLAGADGLVYGADYTPEQWPEEVWAEDARLMQEAHVNLVSVGIFSWAKLEPEPGRYELDWLDRVLDLLHARGVSVDLATPTASPPAWLARLHPDLLPVTAEGVRLQPGSRRHYCPHARSYREASGRIVRVLAEHFGSHPALAMWHIDNEYACHVTECFCDQSIAAFRAWLVRRYGTLETLNDAWATTVWGQRYTSWDEIQPPGPLPTHANPSQALDWRRFCSDSWLECFLDQKAILREVTPTVPVTTNFLGFHKPPDYWAISRNEDLVANDTYPETSDPEWMIEAAMNGDLMRSLGGGRPWLVMEQATGLVTWRERNSTKRPGVMRLASYQSVARGADGLMFFQWRASPAGAEMHHSAMIPHGGTDSRSWREAAALGAELELASEIKGSLIHAQVAILFDWTNWWALESDGKPSSKLLLLPHVRALYRALFRRGLVVDFAEPGDDLSKYRLVIAPLLYLVDDDAAANLNHYVAEGGTLLVSFFSGIVDANSHIRLGGYPSPFRDLLGLLVEEFAPFAGAMTNRVLAETGETFECQTWADVVRLQGSQALATFEGDFYAGRPAVTRNRFGRGSALYMATMLDDGGLAWLIGRACREAGVTAATGAGPAVEVLRRTNGARSWLFVLNYSDAAVDVPLESAAVDLLTGETVEGTVSVAPTDLAILRVKP